MKMRWINLKEEKPPEYHDVLVSQDLYDDDYLNFFVATYWDGENKWLQHLHFPQENSPYIRIERNIKEDDLWCYIDEPSMNDE